MKGNGLQKNGKKRGAGNRTLSRSSIAGRNRVSNRKPKRMLLGRYIVADPTICHGKPTFRGTRVMVYQVLEQVARGMDEYQRKVGRQQF